MRKARETLMKIYVHKLSGRVEIVDDLTGIVDMVDFIAIGAVSAGRDSGKIVGDQTNSYANINPNIVGQKHFGKLSSLYASNTGVVEFYSNNGTNGHYLKMDYDGWDEFDYGLRFKTMDRNQALPHIGLKTIINDAKPDCLSVKKIENAAKKWFSILLKKKKLDIEIIDVDNGGKLTIVRADPDFSTAGEITDETLTMPIGGNIRVNLKQLNKPSLKNNIAIYHKEVYVKSIKIPALCEGYVNYNGLELDPPRQEYRKNAEFDDKLIDYCIKHHGSEDQEEQPHIRQKESKQLIQVVNEVFAAIQQVDADLSFDLFGPQEDTGIKGQVTSGKQAGKWIEQKNVGIERDAKGGQTIIFTGNNGPAKGGTGGGSGTEKGGNARRIIDNGKYSVKTKEIGDDRDDTEKTVIPDIEVIDGRLKDLPTLSFKELTLQNGKKKIVLLINASRPASRILTKVAGIDRLRDIFADKLIRAAYRIKYKGSSIEEFEQKVDQTWNAMVLMKGAKER